MKKALITSLVATALLSTTLPAAASDIKWDQIGAGYESIEIDDSDVKLAGLGFNATKVIVGNFFVNGGYTSVSDDIADIGEVEMDEYRAGVGYKFTAIRGFDLFAQLSYINQDFDVQGGSETDNGRSAMAGVRYKALPILEFGFAVERVDIDDILETKYIAESRLEVASKLDVVAKYSHYDDAKGFSLGATYYF